MYRLIVRTGCHLCADAEQAMTALARQYGIEWESVNIESHSSLSTYTDQVPVLLDDRGVVLARLTSSHAALKRVVVSPWWRRLFK